MQGPSGKYRLDTRLGGGGMAEVFLGSTVGAEGFSRKVAIKRVLPGYSENPQFAQMFVAEAQISSRLVHPNIVSVLDFDRDPENRLFLVMELVEGRDLDALNATGPLPVPLIIYVIAEVLRGLGHAHDLPVGTDVRGIVHRDVSPHNVLLSWDGSVKVSDFGIAKAREASEATASVFIKGKPAYMSPEQANGQPLDGRSDLFAVGIMLWEMLIGRRLFTANDTRATLAAVLFGQVPRPRSVRADVPKDLERVTMKLLERDLPARYATAELAIADLLDCANAPKNGRELLAAILAERFPAAAPVRQSRAAANARLLASGGHPAVTPTPHPVTPASPTQATMHGHGGQTQPAAAMPSLGAVMSAPTATMLPSAGTGAGRSRGTKIAAIAGITAAAAAVAFAIVSAATAHHHGDGGGSANAGSGSGSATIALATVNHDQHDAAPASLPASPADAAAVTPTPTDAGAPSPPPVPIDAPNAPPPISPDAGVSSVADGTSTVKKDATTRQPAHPVADKKFGRLHAIGDPIRTVYVDGKLLGDMPLDKPIAVGRHAIRLVNPDTGLDEHLTINVTDNATTTIDRTH